MASPASLPARNVHPDPARHFEIDPQVLIDAHRAARSGGPRVVGYYHSHPNGLARPSAADSALAANDGCDLGDNRGGPNHAVWRSGDAGFEALPYEVTPR